MNMRIVTEIRLPRTPVQTRTELARRPRAGTCLRVLMLLAALCPALLSSGCKGWTGLGFSEQAAGNILGDSDLDGYRACSATAPAPDCDCDDTTQSVHPNLPDACDERDNDCDGSVDEDVAAVDWFKDGDSDGFGAAEGTADASEEQAAYHGCRLTVGNVANSLDCDDNNRQVYPGADDACDQLDNDCDGVADEDLPTRTYFVDQDGDGFGDSSRESLTTCVLNEQAAESDPAPKGYALWGGDCDDSNFTRNPGAPESCDAVTDLNCDNSVGYFDNDQDGVPACLDCNDNNYFIHGDYEGHPAAPEVCDGVDNDCDGLIDGVDARQLWFVDLDLDGYGDDRTSESLEGCVHPGLTTLGGDCDDTLSRVHPGLSEVCDGLDNDCNNRIDDGLPTEVYTLDRDGDGFGDSAAPPTSSCMPLADYADNNLDCADDDLSRHPGAAESCDSTIDYNCDGSRGYEDRDDDGVPACKDCNDDPLTDLNGNGIPDGMEMSPDHDEVCDGLDNDCDRMTDDIGAQGWLPDSDGDGYYGSDSVLALDGCEHPGLIPVLLSVGPDCDDTDATRHTNAPELCDAIDNDCDGRVDEDLLQTALWLDSDEDGFGDPTIGVVSCGETDGYGGWVSNYLDCDDTDAYISPGRSEVCDGIDNDCDEMIDEEDPGLLPTALYFMDADLDGFGSMHRVTSCEPYPIPGMSSRSDDCDDTRADISPVANEVCNDIDDDCDGMLNEDTGDLYYVDLDRDGHGNPQIAIILCDGGGEASTPASYVFVPWGSNPTPDCDDHDASSHPEGNEVCDGRDNDCDGALLEDEYDVDYDGFFACGEADARDCDDADATVHPMQADACNNRDDNCNGEIDEDRQVLYRDSDDDDFGNTDDRISSCDPTPGYVSLPGDCDETDPSIHPFALDTLNDIDDDCDGSVDNIYRAVSSGQYHTLVLRSDGVVLAFGDNSHGQLGNGTYADSQKPVAVHLPSNIVAIAAGQYHSVALEASAPGLPGRLWGWGLNYYGELAQSPALFDTDEPVPLDSLDRIVAVAAGFNHTLAIQRRDEENFLYAWGRNQNGQVGNGMNTNQFVPVALDLPGIRAVTAGAFHSMALHEDGTVYAWGGNARGELGDGTVLDRFVPQSIPGLENVLRISAGSWHSFALLDGSNALELYAWGDNAYWQLGDGSFADYRSLPTLLTGFPNDCIVGDLSYGTQAAGGSYHSLAVCDLGAGETELYSWGTNTLGQLGDSSSSGSPAPSLISSSFSPAMLSSRDSASFLLENDGLWAWGDNSQGQLGLSDAPGNSSTPRAVPLQP